MPQSLSRILIHLVFSTKNRARSIPPSTRSDLHAYLAGILSKLGCPPIRVGGPDDHVHLLFLLGRQQTVSQIVENVKTSSSKWMKTRGIPGFSWQAGYGALSIAECQVAIVDRYVQNQLEHHRKIPFQEEYRKLLTEGHVPFDERYVWD